MENLTMMTDFYELIMAQVYFNEKKFNEEAYFDGYFRTNPFKGGYAMMGGLMDIIKYLQDFHFTDEDILYLESTGFFTKEFLKYLKTLKFTGSLYAVPDGTAIFPNEPVFTVKANLVEAQIIETYLLACFNHGTLVTTKAKRITSAAQGKPVVDFGARRARGPISAIDASCYAYVGGCYSTSNVLASQKYNIPVTGTMAHSLVQSFPSEYEAFLAYAKSYPNNCILLVDTYDTFNSGIPNAIRVSREFLEPNGYRLKGIRIDSGDLIRSSKYARALLDNAGYTDASICLTNSLDEYKITDILARGACVDVFGVGDNISASKERVDGVYKMMAMEENGEIVPKIKVSGDFIKTTNPGVKKVYRFYDFDSGEALGDAVCKHTEKISKNSYCLISEFEPWKKAELSDYYVKELLIPIFENGNLVYDVPSLDEIRMYCEEEFKTLPSSVTNIFDSSSYYVDLSDEMRELKEYMIFETSLISANTAKENLGYRKKFNLRGNKK